MGIVAQQTDDQNEDVSLMKLVWPALLFIISMILGLTVFI